MDEYRKLSRCVLYLLYGWRLKFVTNLVILSSNLQYENKFKCTKNQNNC